MQYRVKMADAEFVMESESASTVLEVLRKIIKPELLDNIDITLTQARPDSREEAWAANPSWQSSEEYSWPPNQDYPDSDDL